MTATMVRQGKVRDIYDLGDTLLLTASDRISAFDYVLPNEIPDKGRVLTQISRFWFDRLETPHHLLSTEPTVDQLPAGGDPAWFAGRSMVVKKCEVAPVECVVRGYLVGSGWKEYQKTQSVCGVKLPAGLQNGSQLEEPIFTPATKVESGHDENIPFETMAEILGADHAAHLRDQSMEIYLQGAEYARQKGIIIADTKFEWGRYNDAWILIDEVLTPDSSRFWPADQYEAGKNQPSFDKQIVRDYLETTSWDKNSAPPELPAEIISKTRGKYIEAFELLTGESFPWK
ncbi:phosphoribosylaminoimidazolesuccinocarboxamide synthase [Lignipirellula cremea]|uniref:Phosphoribosylaminoimidazole-succinocarboxamide synthase n=1 Tax=Lignipirellula cremea TaxID=2528010 RepID=A0A518DYW4_9BACT|nr:phosphoribosylaminoimidazolesuccinocarboxamide synthase [Lignipirellula cremea]QDU97038.1 Phosphoribosylaminoimidazole-succinocarboxamide synthase [Lignipirellula cremea]